MTVDQAMDEYAHFVNRGVSLEDDTVRERLLLGGFGLAGESGEVVDELKKHIFHGSDLDREKVVKELGDVLWYYTLLLETLGISWTEVIEGNVKKLTERHPQTHLRVVEDV